MFPQNGLYINEIAPSYCTYTSNDFRLQSQFYGNNPVTVQTSNIYLVEMSQSITDM